MKFSVDADELRLATSHARSTVARGHAAPILANVLIEAAGGKAKFRATDIQVELEVSLDANVAEPGGTTVSANVLNDLARRLPPGIPVEFSFDGTKEKLQINSGPTDCSLLTLPKDDFPSMAQSDYDVTFSVEAKILHRLFDMSKLSVAPDSPRKYLQGVCFHVVGEGEDEKILRCVSSDGFQMSRIDAKAPRGCEEMNATIVPQKAVLEVIRMLESGPETVKVSVSENKIRFSTSNMTFSSRVVNAVFPDYNKLIPETANIRLEVDSDAFVKALGRLSAVIPRDGSSVLLTMADDNLNLSVNSPMSGAIQENLDVAFPHEELKIKFNHGHLLGVFGLLGEGTVAVELQPTPGATLFSSSGDENALFVVMPIRV